MKIDQRNAAESLQANPTVRALAAACTKHNIKGHLVGGAVRDFLLQRPEPKDFDVYLEAPPKSLAVVSGEYRTLAQSEQHSNARPAQNLDFFTTRDIEISTGFADFTINSISFDLAESKIVDRWAGIPDLESKTLRITHLPYFFIGRPFFRLFRFAHELGFRYTAETLALLSKHRYMLSGCPAQTRARAMNDLMTALSAHEPLFLEELMRSRLLENFIPQLTPLSVLEASNSNGTSRLEQNFCAAIGVTKVVASLPKEKQELILRYRREEIHTESGKFSCAFNLLSHVKLALLLSGCAEGLLGIDEVLPEKMRSEEAHIVYQRRLLQEIASSVEADPRMSHAVLATMHLLESIRSINRPDFNATRPPRGPNMMHTCAAVALQSQRTSASTKILASARELEAFLASPLNQNLQAGGLP
jgi:tRNA nucleotidyltransferase/poly(A) polymerase